MPTLTPPAESVSEPAACSGVFSPLASLARGARGVVVSVQADGTDGVLLESMGLRRNARVRVCRTGRTCVVVCEGADRCSCRLGLERRLAERVMVAPAAP